MLSGAQQLPDQTPRFVQPSFLWVFNFKQEITTSMVWIVTFKVVISFCSLVFQVYFEM